MSSNDERLSEEEDVSEGEDFWNDERTPLRFLQSVQPFPNLLIDGHPIRIIDRNNFDEDTDQDDLTAADGIATALWHWLPDALRAFLDRESFYSFEWSWNWKVGQGRGPTTVIARNDRAIDLRIYNFDMQCNLGCQFGMPADGPWVPLGAIQYDARVGNVEAVPDFGRMFAADCLYQKVWEAGKLRSHKLDVRSSPGAFLDRPLNGDSRRLYGVPSADKCLRCSLDPGIPLRRCSKCKSAHYCSNNCQTKDWAVHKMTCKSPA